MNIALDWDGTVTHDIATWAAVVQVFKAAGHHVWVVTMRAQVEGAGMDRRVLDHVDGVIFTHRHGKRPFVESLGLHIHVWIDDNPEAVLLSAGTVWQRSTPVGTIIDPADPDSDAATVRINVHACVEKAFELHDRNTFYLPV